jgi:hypothetical protein
MKSFVFIVFLFSTWSCTSNNGNAIQGFNGSDSLATLMPTYDTLKWDSKVENAIDSFTKETQCDSCINEIYIDKILPDSVLITLKARVYAPEIMRQSNSLFSCNIHGKIFYIFSGLEDVLKGNKKFLPVEGDTSGSKFNIWTLAIKGDKLNIIKGVNYPFFPTSQPRVEIRK